NIVVTPSPHRSLTAFHEIGRYGEEMRLARMPQAISLECAEVVRVAELGAELFENLPVLLLRCFTDCLGQMPFQIRGNAIVIEKGVVDIEQEDHALHVSVPPPRR